MWPESRRQFPNIPSENLGLLGKGQLTGLGPFISLSLEAGGRHKRGSWLRSGGFQGPI